MVLRRLPCLHATTQALPASRPSFAAPGRADPQAHSARPPRENDSMTHSHIVACQTSAWLKHEQNLQRGKQRRGVVRRGAIDFCSCVESAISLMKQSCCLTYHRRTDNVKSDVAVHAVKLANWDDIGARGAVLHCGRACSILAKASPLHHVPQ